MMKILESFNEYKENKELFLSIGFFDGIHLGHQQVLKILVHNARSNNCPSAVVTFSFHPFKALGSSRQPFSILPLKQRLNYIEQMGVDYTFVLDFNKKIADMAAQDFIEKIIVKKLKVKEIYIGENFHFGKDRLGDVGLLKKEGKKLGFEVTSIPLLRTRDEFVSSTKIRKYITEGNFEKTEQLLGRKYSLFGKVSEGKGISKDIKYPTANMHFDEILLPPEGIYAGWVKIDPVRELRSLPNGVNYKIYKSAFFVATEPKRLIEAHVIDLKENIYHKEVEIIFFKKIRSRVIFKTRTEAQNQIAEDVGRVEGILS
jgi:riboflavin kinase/FMN adenylyltransferase